ncbi:MAG TPA: cation diffusion facilitator family transporter [Candidatus Lustribacter sp.]|nr:cation diffusion facilitator family transporter [Candidatus Lustribacter sp.]
MTNASPAAGGGPGTAPAATRDLTRYAWLAIAAAITTILLKAGAWLLTGSVGLLSDAAESIVNLVAAVVALIALRVAAMPADDNHHFGHTKAEYFSAAIEGVMIFVAAVVILITSVQRFLSPLPLENIGVGLGISAVASVVNGAVAFVLIRAGRAYRSVTLTADGRHLVTDVWTSVGVIVGVLGVAATGWLRLDPIVAFAVGVNIIVTGSRLLSMSINGLMDHAMSEEEHATINHVLDGFASDEVVFHALRTRESGHQRFLSVHVLVPGAWSVRQGHDLVSDVEDALSQAYSDLHIETHLEPIEDPRAYGDAPADVRTGITPV